MNLEIQVGEWIPFMPIWKQGQIGVSIFFVLSGFLITRIYFAALLTRQVSLREYFVKRVARIWPLFLLLAVVEHVAMLARGTRPDATWAVTLTMTQGFFLDLYNRGLPTAWSLTVEDHLEAFAAHPKIGEAKTPATGDATWSKGEQAGATTASAQTLADLEDANRAYEAQLGFIFIVCASGRSAEDMLRDLRMRLANSREVELRTAAEEQAKITRLRLTKLALELRG